MYQQQKLNITIFIAFLLPTIIVHVPLGLTQQTKKINIDKLKKLGGTPHHITINNHSKKNIQGKCDRLT